ncbi:adenylate/guanylate cyclase domain-containing protein [Bradyrhizobium rifense]|uniref:Adenylate/guanylate cyclase domain-containing protein n=1 Tax=Bradyrhizobium rifense TaxID=515499 RepID=A0A5D3JZN5_9BRAD|nr:adenylate/guanylate cyclase domain-containing protein [Bradyrhizobium rifense]TYL87521.1 adenylate/guanylate cyclase domain-containing protein [Bradyrhizobium rifense]
MAQELPVRVERKLAAILAADVAGYSRLMHHDEEATHAKLAAVLTDAVTPAISAHGGRVVKNTGDGFLADFPSAVEAVRSALQFQNRIKELTSTDAKDERIALRVGINVGDVIVEPHDIFGDGVNIAARLESIAEPGGICISAAAYEHIQGKIAAGFIDMGELSLKNIDRPVRTYAVVPHELATATAGTRSWPNSILSPLSIVVLPLANLSGDPDQDYFVDGVTESLTTDLSRIRGSLVVARNTAFSYKGKSIDIRQVGRELTVRYVLEGSVQRGGNRFRVNVQLVDAQTGNHLWAERFDKPLADLLDMQDEIVSRLANTLNAQLIAAEAERAARSLHPTALDLYFQGMARWNKRWTLENMVQARDFFERALKLDPDHVEALVGIASIDMSIAGFLLSDNVDEHFVVAERALVKASLAPHYPPAHAFLGCLQLCTNRAAQGIAECEYALTLNPNLADAHAFIGVGKIHLGRAAEAEADINEAFRLSPRDEGAHRWMCWIGFGKFVLGADDDAVVWLRRGLKANPNYPIGHFQLAAALALIGKLDEARVAAKEGLALDPSFTIRRMKNNAFSDDPMFRAAGKRSIQGMRLAGLPEG